MQEPVSKPWSHRILDLATPAVLFGTPALYVLGRIYSEGYWTTLGFPASVMARAAEDYVYFGFVAMVSAITIAVPRLGTDVVWLAPLMSIALIAGSAFAIWGLAKIRRRLRPLLTTLLARLRDYLSERRDGLEAIGKASAIVEAATSVALLLLLGSLVLTLPVVLAFSIGQVRAERAHQSLSTGTSTRAEVNIKSRGDLRGRVVDCTSEHCVIYAATGYLLTPREDVEWLPVSPLPQDPKRQLTNDRATPTDPANTHPDQAPASPR